MQCYHQCMFLCQNTVTVDFYDNNTHDQCLQGMQRFYKMWLEQLYHHLKLANSPSQSSAVGSAQQGQFQRASKQAVTVNRWTLDALLPLVALIVMVAWLLLQSVRQQNGLSRFQSISGWPSNHRVLPDLVPLPYQGNISHS